MTICRGAEPVTDSAHGQWATLPRSLQRKVGTGSRVGGIELYGVAPHHISAFFFFCRKAMEKKRRIPFKTDICGLNRTRLVLNSQTPWMFSYGCSKRHDVLRYFIYRSHPTTLLQYCQWHLSAMQGLYKCPTTKKSDP